MQRSYLPRWPAPDRLCGHAVHCLRGLALAVGLLGTQCLDSISDDCTKTLTCPDDEQPILQENCEWVYPDGRPWPGGPSLDVATNTWRWPDGKATETQDFDCNPGLADAGPDGGPAGPRCGVTFECDPGRTCDPVTGECFECVTDAECAGNMPMGDAGAATVCDTASHRCVQCLGDDNCTGDTGVCKVDEANSRRNSCVECLADGHCSAPNPICDERSNDCTASCQSQSDCTGDKKACNTTLRICVECTENAQCAGTDKPLCDVASNQCVECIDDGQCAASGRVCDLESHSCVECKADQQCLSGPNAATLPHCDLEAKQCVACLNDQHCINGAASRCNAAHVCTGCTDSNQCEGGFQCRTGECVECLSDANCTNGERCETVRGLCVECFDTSQCTQPEAARCETSPAPTADATRYTCVGCTQNTDCAPSKGLSGLCVMGECVDCTGTGPSPECSNNPALSRCQNGSCAICIDDADCSLFTDENRLACKSGTGCVECDDSTDCTDTPATPVCKIAAGTAPDGGGGPAAVNTCVECVSDDQCRTDAGAARCANNACVPCVADADCSGFDSNGTDPGGTPLLLCDAGTCVECTGTRRGACGVNVCNSRTKACALGRPAGGAGLCDECVSDFECAEDARCVEQTAGGTSIGFFCVPIPTGAPPSCNPQRPFAGAANLNTLDTPGLTAVCTLRQTTCPGLDDRTEACDQDTNCGAANVADGLCVEFGGDNVCTIPCVSEFDCNTGADCVSGGCEL